ncbi:MAG: DUF4482 domain-containing protein, partial [Candidatus Pacebacteria bacterium]|nr:DUF4482 domain-containing protein [Candidatus Paceibacterota bacterium]
MGWIIIRKSVIDGLRKENLELQERLQREKKSWDEMFQQKKVLERKFQELCGKNTGHKDFGYYPPSDRDDPMDHSIFICNVCGCYWTPTEEEELSYL